VSKNLEEGLLLSGLFTYYVVLTIALVQKLKRVEIEER
jgi:hypothetical protein